MNKLYIIPCGSKKIFSKYPSFRKVPAKKVYIGGFTRNMIKLAEKYRWDYYIFSGVYGLIHPDTPLNDYDSGGKLCIPFEKLVEQVKNNNLESYDKCITLCNNEFNQHLERIFPNLEKFFKPNMILGERQSYIKKKLNM